MQSLYRTAAAVPGSVGEQGALIVVATVSAPCLKIVSYRMTRPNVAVADSSVTKRIKVIHFSVLFAQSCSLARCGQSDHALSKQS